MLAKSLLVEGNFDVQDQPTMERKVQGFRVDRRWKSESHRSELGNHSGS
jgi:hypothetical protein